MGAETYYQGLTNGYINLAGMRTVEQYLIKAECLARKNQLTDAMDVLNEVRKTYILPEKYQPLSASSVAEAIRYVRQARIINLSSLSCRLAMFVASMLKVPMPAR